MSLNRWLLLIAVLAGSTAGVLAFGNPQWNKHIYIFQLKYVSKNLGGMETLSHDNWDDGHFEIRSSPARILPPKNYVGLWIDWFSHGDPLRITEFKRSSEQILIFDAFEGIDQRTEFGIEVK